MIAKPETYPLLWHGAKWDFGTPTGHQFTLDASMPREQLEQTLDSELRKEEARSGHKLEPSGIREILLNRVDERERARDQAPQTWLITILPPIALLLLGIAIGWVIGGFRKDRSPQPA
jgi:hypothetical protein